MLPQVDNGSVDVKVVRAFRAHFPKVDSPQGFPLHPGDFKEGQRQIMAEGGQKGSFVNIEGRPVFLDHGVALDDMHNGLITRLAGRGSLSAWHSALNDCNNLAALIANTSCFVFTHDCDENAPNNTLAFPPLYHGLL